MTSESESKIFAQKSAWTYFIRFHKVAFLTGCILAVWGILSAVTIPKESAPYIPYGVVSINTVYTGVSAEEIDTLITQKIENKVKSVSNINKMSSVSRNSISAITVEFEPDTNMIKAVSDIRSKVDEAKAELPNDLDSDPTVLEIDSALEPFFTLVLSGQYSDITLRDYAEDLKLFLESVPDVAAVNISGGADREILVALDPNKLKALQISVSEVLNAIRSSHQDTPIGGFDIGSEQYNIRFLGKHRTAEDIAHIQIKNLSRNNTVSLITVGDIASVTEQGKDTNEIRRLGIPSKKVFENAIQLSVSKSTGKNIFVVDERVRTRALAYIAENFPADLRVTFLQEIVTYAQEDFDNVQQSGIQAIVIVMILLFIFIGFRAGMVASLVIPLTFLTTIGVLAAMGSTLNFMTNFSMILALGILVDTAVVIVEGIHYHLHKGYSPKKAAIMSLHEFKQPLISGTLTTLAVFVPLFSLPGVLGKYLSFIPITVFIVLTSALFISLLLITAYGSQLMISSEEEAQKNTKCWKIQKIANSARQVFTKVEKNIIHSYGSVLRKMLNHRWLRLSMFYSILVLFFLSFLIPIKFEMFPQGDAPFFTLSLERPEGTTVEETATYVPQLEEMLIDFPEIKAISTTISGDSATINVELLPEQERAASGLSTSTDLTNTLKKQIEPIAAATGSNIRIQSAQNGPPSEFPVAFRVIAQESRFINAAEETAKELTEMLKKIQGTTGVRNDVEMIPGEFVYTVDRDKALALKVNPDEIARLVRTVIQGSTAAVISRDTRDVDVVIEYDEQSKQDIEQIDDIQIPNAEGTYISLSQVTTKKLTSSFSTLRRRDGRIAFTVSSLLSENGNAAEVTEKFLAVLQNYTPPTGVEIKDAGENEENAELFAALGSAFVIAMLIMFLILVIQFNSYLHPFLILFTILFAQIGVAIGLYITDTPRSLAYILGVISLAGIVVNDAIIMVDQMNKVSRGDPTASLRDAIMRAGKSRFVPVILTTLTTSAGIIPLVFVDAFWAGLSYTVIFGLSVASFLTLFVTPAMYYQLEREKVITFVPLAIVAMIAGLFAAPIIGKIILLVLLYGAFVLVKKYYTKTVLEEEEILAARAGKHYVTT